MVVKRRKKHEGFRGKRHYHGSHKKHKGAGGRGGRGQAGLKDHKLHWRIKYDPEHFGKHGFKRHSSLMKHHRTINLKELDLLVDKLVEQKKAEQQDGKVKVTLEKIGYDKLLGTGKITKPVIVETKHFSKNVAKKLEEAGGKLVKIE